MKPEDLLLLLNDTQRIALRAALADTEGKPWKSISVGYNPRVGYILPGAANGESVTPNMRIGDHWLASAALLTPLGYDVAMLL